MGIQHGNFDGMGKPRREEGKGEKVVLPLKKGIFRE
jgi:hypothetical protein